MNLTPVSHVIKYKDTFLSIEFERLEARPTRGYEGPYQRKYDITPEILEDLVRLEGVNLSQMQSQFTELARHVQEWAALARRFDDFLNQMERHTAAIERLVVSRASGVGPDAEVASPAREIPFDQAVQEVLGLCRERQRLFYSDIAEALRLDLATIVAACQELERRGLIEGERRE